MFRRFIVWIRDDANMKLIQLAVVVLVPIGGVIGWWVDHRSNQVNYYASTTTDEQRSLALFDAMNSIARESKSAKGGPNIAGVDAETHRAASYLVSCSKQDDHCSHAVSMILDHNAVAAYYILISDAHTRLDHSGSASGPDYGRPADELRTAATLLARLQPKLALVTYSEALALAPEDKPFEEFLEIYQENISAFLAQTEADDQAKVRDQFDLLTENINAPIRKAPRVPTKPTERPNAKAIADGSRQTAGDLGDALTPMGAIRAGNDDRTIPTWTGGISRPPLGWHVGMPRLDPFPDEKPSFYITSTNLNQYESRLAAGSAALIRRLPNYRLGVYPTHRTFAAPQFIYDNAITNATRAKLTNDGQDVEGAKLSIPFPIPHNGNEAVWNHILRWRGSQIVRHVVNAIITPLGDYSTRRRLEKLYFPYGIPGQNSPTKQVAMLWQEALSPPNLEGMITLSISYQSPFEQPDEVWKYFPRDHQVSHFPDIGYDTPDDSAGGLATLDDFDLFNGALDRFDWKLVGRREIFVPYNTYKFQDPRTKYSDLLNKDGLSPDFIRWELHRVWVVDGSLKPNRAHIYSRRTLYLDEDSWQALISDRYDHYGQLWRTGMAMAEQFPDVPILAADGYVQMDFHQHRCLVQGMHSEETPPKYDNSGLNAIDFTPDALIRFGRR